MSEWILRPLYRKHRIAFSARRVFSCDFGERASVRQFSPNRTACFLRLQRFSPYASFYRLCALEWYDQARELTNGSYAASVGTLWSSFLSQPPATWCHLDRLSKNLCPLESLLNVAKWEIKQSQRASRCTYLVGLHVFFLLDSECSLETVVHVSDHFIQLLHIFFDHLDSGEFFRLSVST